MGLLRRLYAIAADTDRARDTKTRGELGEAKTDTAFAFFLPAEYQRFANVILRTSGGTTEIDHVIVSPYGIFIVETKAWRGEISGLARDKYWTVRLNGREKRYLSPLVQNQGHIAAASQTVDLPEKYFHSLIFFWSESCTLKPPIPENVRRTGLCGYIKSKRKRLLSHADVRYAVAMIKALSIAPTEKNRESHAASVRARFGG